MRAACLLLCIAACTPEIVSGAYLCGPDAACPEGQACNGADNTCVLASLAGPFECEDSGFEPDDTAEQGYLLPNLTGCVSAPVRTSACMMEGDVADWVKFVAPSSCTAVEVEARLSFPLAFEELGFELWDLDRDEMLSTDSACTQGADIGDERRCLDHALVPATLYGIRVRPTGKGNCGGACAYNRYTLQIQLATPG